jgi:hypothetical protein
MIDIFHEHHAAWEGWLYLDEDGAFKYHTENDGPTFLRRGAEPKNEILNFEEALKRFPKFAQQIYDAAKHCAHHPEIHTTDDWSKPRNPIGKALRHDK